LAFGFDRFFFPFEQPLNLLIVTVLLLKKIFEAILPLFSELNYFFFFGFPFFFSSSLNISPN